MKDIQQSYCINYACKCVRSGQVAMTLTWPNLCLVVTQIVPVCLSGQVQIRFITNFQGPWALLDRVPRIWIHIWPT